MKFAIPLTNSAPPPGPMGSASGKARGLGSARVVAVRRRVVRRAVGSCISMVFISTRWMFWDVYASAVSFRLVSCGLISSAGAGCGLRLLYQWPCAPSLLLEPFRALLECLTCCCIFCTNKVLELLQSTNRPHATCNLTAVARRIFFSLGLCRWTLLITYRLAQIQDSKDWYYFNFCSVIALISAVHRFLSSRFAKKIVLSRQ